MTAQEILQLMQGGFTHDEIIQLCTNDTVPAPVPAPEPAPAPAPEPAPAQAQAPAPVPDPVPAPEPDQPNISDLINANRELQLQVAKLTSAVQANAIQNSLLPGVGTPKSSEEAAADVIAQIIRPTRKKEV